MLIFAPCFCPLSFEPHQGCQKIPEHYTETTKNNSVDFLCSPDLLCDIQINCFFSYSVDV